MGNALTKAVAFDATVRCVVYLLAVPWFPDGEFLRCVRMCSVCVSTAVLSDARRTLLSSPSGPVTNGGHVGGASGSVPRFQNAA